MKSDNKLLVYGEIPQQKDLHLRIKDLVTGAMLRCDSQYQW
jgi:hypothetical protein